MVKKKVTKGMADKLAKKLLGKAVFVSKDENSYLYKSGEVEIYIRNETKGYDRMRHRMFGTYSDTYREPCVWVQWFFLGQNAETYHKLDDLENVFYAEYTDAEHECLMRKEMERR